MTRTYAKLIDDFPEHQKVVGLTDAAFRLYVTALCYSSRNLTDGTIPEGALRRLGGSTASAGALTRANLWHEEDGGWRIHDYLQHQRSRETIMQQRADSVARATQSKRNRREVAAQPDRNPSRQSSEFRVQSSDNPTTTAGARDRDAAGWYEATTGRKPSNSTLGEQLANLDRAHPAECVAWAFGQSASMDNPWPYVKRVLDSCILGGEGHGPREKEKGNGGRTSQGNRTVRQGDGRHLGASQRVPGAGVDWEQQAADEDRRLARAGGGDQGLSEAEVGQDV